MILAADFVKELKLTELSPSTHDEWDIRSADLNRPGMQFCGFYEYFAYERPQVIGKVEMTYLEQLPPDVLRERLERFFSYDLPCVICCRNMLPPQLLLDVAREHNVAVYITPLLTTRFQIQALNYMNRILAPRVMRHGVLVDVNGTGVLITGESGSGKSEAALELIKRGHQLVADDVVDICRVSDSRLVGECPEMVRNFMEIRGIGIINIRAMFGVSAVLPSKSIDLVMHLENWVEGKEYDRLGSKEETVTILGVKVPHLAMPVRPGRNLAVIIEVAVRNQTLKHMGYSAPMELDRRMNEMIMKNAAKSNYDR